MRGRRQRQPGYRRRQRGDRVLQQLTRARRCDPDSDSTGNRVQGNGACCLSLRGRRRNKLPPDRGHELRRRQRYRPDCFGNGDGHQRSERRRVCRGRHTYATVNRDTNANPHPDADQNQHRRPTNVSRRDRPVARPFGSRSGQCPRVRREPELRNLNRLRPAATRPYLRPWITRIR